MENSKWSADDDAVLNVTLPFTRMFLGPMDFTPGAMTNWTPRDLEAYQDGVNADRMASDYKLVKSKVNKNARMKIHLVEGGGWAARIHA